MDSIEQKKKPQGVGLAQDRRPASRREQGLLPRGGYSLLQTLAGKVRCLVQQRLELRRLQVEDSSHLITYDQTGIPPGAPNDFLF